MVWGLGYIDELVQVAVNQDPQNAGQGTTENLCELFYWPLCDANYNVLGLVNQNGQLIERYEYTPYGQREVFSKGRILADMNDDGYVDVADLSFYYSQEGTGPANSRADLDGDGDIDLADKAIYSASIGQTIAGVTADPLVMYHRSNSFRGGYLNGASGEPLCSVGHQGLLHDEEFGLIYNRARMLHPILGRGDVLSCL